MNNKEKAKELSHDYFRRGQLGLVSPEYSNNIGTTDFDRAIAQCDMLRREFIIKSAREIGLKRHKKVY